MTLPAENAPAFPEDLDRLKYAMKVSGLGIWELQQPGNMVSWDERCQDLFGLKNLDVLRYEEAITYIYADDKHLVHTTLLAALDRQQDGRYDVQFRTNAGPDGQVRWVRFSGQAFFNEEGQPTRVSGIAQDMTELVRSNQYAMEAQSLATVALEASHAGSFRLTIENDHLEYSPAFAKIMTGHENSQMRRSDFIDFIHPDDRLQREEAYQRAGGTGNLNYEARTIWKDHSVHWVRIRGTFIINASESGPRMFTGTVQDITEEKHQRLHIEGKAAQAAANELRLSHIVEISPDMITRWNRNLQLVFANVAFEIQMAKPLASLLGKSMLEMSQPERVAVPFSQSLRGVLETAQPRDHHSEFPTPAGNTYFYSRLVPELSEDGEVQSIVSIARDVSEIRASEQRFRSLIEQSPVATCLFVGADMRVEVANESMLDFWGKNRSILGQPLAEAVPELRGQPFLDILLDVFTSGETYSANAAEAFLHGENGPGIYYFDFTYKPLRNAAGDVYGIMGMAVDVTEQVIARKAVEQAEANLRGAIELAELATWNLDLSVNRLTCTDRLVEWFGLDSNDEPLEVVLKSIHDKDRDRINNAVNWSLNPASQGLYNEEYTVVHPKTGQERVVHAQGKTRFDATGKAVVLLGTAQDITIQREMQTALEQQVLERTEQLAGSNAALKTKNEELAESNEQLKHSNEELAQYAYVASHDLQEPLRKIRLFSGMLITKEYLTEDIKVLIDKIGQSSERMSMLIRDLLEFSKLLKSDTLVRPVDLQEVTVAVANDFELLLEEKKATLLIGKMPTLQAVALQMNQLFYNLLGNALKFDKPGRTLVVEVKAIPIDQEDVSKFISKPLAFAQYYHITIRDNGIGFELKYSEHIFEVFKRLHGRDLYPGSGIGLAICRRIVVNHNGFLFAESVPGEGSVFHLILPDKQKDFEATLPNGFQWKNP